MPEFFDFKSYNLFRSRSTGTTDVYVIEHLEFESTFWLFFASQLYIKW